VSHTAIEVSNRLIAQSCFKEVMEKQKYFCLFFWKISP